MGLIRVIIFSLVIWLAWRLIQNQLNKLKSQSKEKTRVDNQTMVKCEHCGTHIPQSSALKDQERWFCSKTHLEDFSNK